MCPECGAPCYYLNPSPSATKGRDYDYQYAYCLGVVKREGWCKTKSGEKKYRKEYSKPPCGWEDGINPKTAKKVVNPFDAIRLGEVTPQSATDKAHTKPVNEGPLTLSSYRHG